MRISESFDQQYRVNEITGCHEWQRGKARGYGYFYSGGGRQRMKNVLAHRFAYERAFGPIPEGLHVCHRCDNPACVNPDHLFAASNTVNRRDSVAKGRAAHGERHGLSKITADQVKEIRSLAGTMPQHRIGELFQISQTQISRIVRGDRWKHL